MEQRKSNIEQLRIVSITMIVISHCTYKSSFCFGFGFSSNELLVESFRMPGNLRVNIFMLISGYFMQNGQAKWKKLVLLLLELQFYYWLSVLIAWQTDSAVLSLAGNSS